MTLCLHKFYKVLGYVHSLLHNMHSDSPQCVCLHREESTLHYFVDCFLYLPERQILFSKIEHHIPHFKNYSKKKKIDLILRGYNPDNVEYTQLNTTLTIAVQRYIIQTKRFL